MGFERGNHSIGHSLVALFQSKTRFVAILSKTNDFGQLQPADDGPLEQLALTALEIRPNE